MEALLAGTQLLHQHHAATRTADASSFDHMMLSNTITFLLSRCTNTTHAAGQSPPSPAMSAAPISCCCCRSAAAASPIATPSTASPLGESAGLPASCPRPTSTKPATSPGCFTINLIPRGDAASEPGSATAAAEARRTVATCSLRPAGDAGLLLLVMGSPSKLVVLGQPGWGSEKLSALLPALGSSLAPAATSEKETDLAMASLLGDAGREWAAGEEAAELQACSSRSAKLLLCVMPVALASVASGPCRTLKGDSGRVRCAEPTGDPGSTTASRCCGEPGSKG